MGDLVKELSGANLTVVVAHQDDESLWFGGLLSQLPRGTVKHLVCVCSPTPGRPDTDTRMAAFEKVADALGATAHCLSVTNYSADDTVGAGSAVAPAMLAIQTHLDTFPADVIITHGHEGEPCAVYKHGHAMHRVVSACVTHVAVNRGCLNRIVRRDEVDPEYIVSCNRAKKKALLDFYAPQWTPERYPAYEPEGYTKWESPF